MAEGMRALNASMHRDRIDLSRYMNDYMQRVCIDPSRHTNDCTYSMEVLPPLDHAVISYAPFRKGFYQVSICCDCADTDLTA